MKRAEYAFVIFMTTAFFITGIGLCENRERADIGEKYKWKLEDIYFSDLAWEIAKDKLVPQFEQIVTYRGKVAGSAKELLECLELDTKFSKELSRLYNYASMKSDQDMRDSKYLAMKQQMEQVMTDYSSLASFILPEIAAMDKDKIDKFIKKESGLEIYRMPLYDVLRIKAHTLSEKEEKILAQSGMLADGPASINSIFSNAELPYPEITLSDGTKAKLTKAGYGLYRAAPNRADRKAVFNAFWTTFTDFRRTFGTQLYAEVKKNIFYARCRNYESALHRALDNNNIPTEVYLALIENVNNNLDTLHRYLRLKAKMLGVDDLDYSDLYVSPVKSVDLKYTFDEARDMVIDSFKPLGEEYTRTVEKALDERWIDVYPTPGKRSGAYSNDSVYDVHPYILLNYNEQYEDVSTLAHELGHTMHGYFANKTQPYPTADYSIFVAEVASIFNEALLLDKVLKDIKDNDTRISILMNYLETARTTLFRQTQFAEFELRIHQAAEKGEPLTGDVLSGIYGDIIKKYYGHDEGVCNIEELYTVEWAYIPHFYYNFYVYQYSTSFCASTALAEEVLAGEAGAVEKYIKFLSAGGSEYPIPLLKKAGVDMTGSKPFDKTIAAMNRAMDEVEKLLSK